MLLFEASEQGFFVEGPRLGLDVDIQITGITARVKVSQRFENPSDKWTEATYVFPLPETAAVDSLRMQVGDRFIEGQIKERGEARQIYDDAKQEGLRAGLLEQERPNVFQSSVANIGPREIVIVQMEYQQAIPIAKGEARLRFPLVVAPRYDNLDAIESSGGSGGAPSDVPMQAPAAFSMMEDFLPVWVLRDAGPDANLARIHATVRAGGPLDYLESSFHRIDKRLTGDRQAEIQVKGDIPADRDFELVWRTRDSAGPEVQVFREDVAGETYAMALVSPPSSSAHAALPRVTIFVIDNSGSMGGESMKQAKQALDLGLSRLSRKDRFNVIRFDDSMTELFPKPVAATERNVDRARRYVDDLEAEGGTEMLPALKEALRDDHETDATHVRQIVFVTDGAVGYEDAMFQEIAANLGRSRLFTVGIGSAPNSFFMNRAARVGRGTFVHVGSVEQVFQRVGELLQRIESPALTSLEAEGSGAELWPNPVPDAYAGEPVVVFAHWNAGAAASDIGLSGVFDGQPWSSQAGVHDAPVGVGISKLWARGKIESLEEGRYRGVDQAVIDAGVLDVALAFHLVSRRTSLVAVELAEPARPASDPLRTMPIALRLPHGWDFEKVFGPLKAHADGPPHAGAERIRALAPSKRDAALSAESTDLPQGATSMQLLALLGIACLLAAFAWLKLVPARASEAAS